MVSNFLLMESVGSLCSFLYAGKLRCSCILSPYCCLDRMTVAFPLSAGSILNISFFEDLLKLSA